MSWARADGGGGAGTPSLPTPPIPPEGAQPSPNISSVRSPTDGIVTTGNQLWLRKWALSVGDASGKNALDLSQLGFEFEVICSQLTPPWVGRIKIYNVGDNVISRLSKELTHVHLSAGYMDPSKQYGDIFNGSIAFYKAGRESAVDTFVEIYGTTNDPALNAAIVNKWLPADWTQDDVVKACTAAMAPYGVTLGQITQLPDEKSPRGRVLFGMARDILRDIARQSKAQVFIDQDGKLHILKESEALAMGNETVPVLNSKSGMIDIPRIVLGGAVEVECLLNPAIKPGRHIKIDQKVLATTTKVSDSELVTTAYRVEATSNMLKQANGTFVVASVKHYGQNRGQPWFSSISSMPAIPGGVGITTSAPGT